MLKFQIWSIGLDAELNEADHTARTPLSMTMTVTITITSLPSFESDDDVTEETQTESTTVQYQKSKDRAVQFAQIDQLKQQE